MPEIVPAIIAKSFDELEEKIRAVEDTARLVQLDIMDNIFVPNETWRNPLELSLLKRHPEMEAHLMVINPQHVIGDWIRSAVKRVIPHWEAVCEEEREEVFAQMLKDAHGAGKEFGIALNPETDWREMGRFLSVVDVTLFLSVHPGFYGKEFIPEVIGKVEALRKNQKNAIIEIDGGIKLSNVEFVARAGVDRIVVGSAIFKDSNPSGVLRALQRAAV